jgi:hypothetical protein
VREIVVGIGADQAFGEIEGLDEEEPMIIVGGDALIGRAIDGPRRYDVEDGDLADMIGMVERHAVGDAAAAVVAGDAEALESEGGHRLHLVLCHRPFGVGIVLAIAFRFAAVAIAAQVRRHDGEMRAISAPRTSRHAIGEAMRSGRGGCTADREIDLAARVAMRLRSN